MQTAIEKLAEVKAENELFSLGWVKGKCLKCNGTGIITLELPGFSLTPTCATCEGSGIDWVPKPEEAK